MGIKSISANALADVTAANTTSNTSHQNTIIANAKAAWVNKMGVIVQLATTGGTPTVVNLAAGQTPETIALLQQYVTATRTFDVGTVSQLTNHASMAASADLLQAVTPGSLTSGVYNSATVTFQAAMGRAITGADYMAWPNIIGGATTWVVDGASNIATATIDGLSFRYRDDANPAVIEVYGKANQGVSQWLPCPDEVTLGQYLASGAVV